MPRAVRVLTRAACATIRHAHPQAKNGTVYRGVFAGATLEPKNFGVTLRFVTVTAPGAATDAAPAARPQPTVTIGAKDFAHLCVKNVALTEAALGAGGDGDGFATDAAIGARKAGRAGRELVAWQPDEGDTGPVLAGLMEGAPSRGGGGAGRGGGSGGANGVGWDQFAANRAVGVVSPFDENMYTTRLDMSKIGISEAEAARLAREIEGQGTRNLHAAEERGQHVGADDDDEEARFSSVLRAGEGGGGSAAVDAANDETFGDHVPSTLDGFAKPPAPAAASGEAKPEETPKKSGLNPNAKPFSFNPAAKSFVPSPSAAAAAAGTAAGGAAAAAAAAAMNAAAVAGGAYGFVPPGGPRSPMGGAAGWPRGAPYMGMPGGMPMAQMGPGGFPMGMPMMGMMPALGMGFVPPQGWRGPGGGMMMMPGMPMPPMQPASPQPGAGSPSPPQSSEGRGGA